MSHHDAVHVLISEAQQLETFCMHQNMKSNINYFVLNKDIFGPFPVDDMITENGNQSPFSF